MREKIVPDLWEYEIHDDFINYGYTLTIYKNKVQIYNQSGYGSIGTAEASARDYFLLYEFNIERDNNE